MDDRALRPEAFLAMDRSLAADIFVDAVYPWEAISRIAALVARLVAEPPPGYSRLADGIVVGEGVEISPRAELKGPAVIGPGTEIRIGAFVRENVLVGSRCVIGNSTELKNCVLFDEAQAPHFNYVGDSILGYRAHLGAGAVLSNLKSDKSVVAVLLSTGTRIETGLTKFGAVVGDEVEIGCNVVCYPGTLVGRRATVYPLCAVRGIVAGGAIVKPGDVIVPRLEGGRPGRT